MFKRSQNHVSVFQCFFHLNLTKWTENAFILKFQSGKKITKDNLTYHIFEGLKVSFNKSLMMMMQIVCCFDFSFIQTIAVVCNSKLGFLRKKKWTVKVLIQTFYHLFIFKMNCTYRLRRCVKKLKWSYFPIQFRSEKCKYWWRRHSTPFQVLSVIWW